MTESLKLLNIGCGPTFHPSWINLDVEPRSSQVRRHDLRDGLPFPDGEFDLVITPAGLFPYIRYKARLIRECKRVSRKDGRAFLEGIFQRYRGHFGPHRRWGACPMRLGDWGGLCTLRDLRLQPVSRG